jgi:hypothetical protein
VIPEDYTVEKTGQRVVGQRADLVTRFRWRADRRCRKLNADKRVPFYRWEVIEWHEKRWAVVAMQNVAVPRRASAVEPDTPPAA